MDLRAQLQAHLGDAFLLERELGGGGMSRVFVAQEVRLSRKVAIKVLSPELVQGLNAERFEREILLAASLQQANIVGVLAAGEVDGLPYFTMPFVEGESLRSRITVQGMPIADVLAILRDVTKALAYAHARGIVHRDIKPDNVLLSGGTAMVTDFGIAKAISASRSATGATLTSVGSSIGTPAYMAPEQVAGDPNIDHRVDLYALGCMAYELLTGGSPFGDRTPQKMLAAHLSETPKSLGSLRSDSPAALNRLVAQLLEKDPVDRPGSANDVLLALDAVSTTSSPTLALDAPGQLPRVLAFYAVATGAVAILAKAAVVGIGLPSWVFPGAVLVMLLGLPALLFTAYVKRVARKAAMATPTLTPGGTMQAKPLSGTMQQMAMKANPHLSWRRAVRGGIYAMSAFVMAVAGFMGLRAAGIGAAGSLFAKGELAADDQIVLAEFTVPEADSGLAPILGAAVRAAMSQSSSVRLVDENGVVETLNRMQRDPDSKLSMDLAREVAERAGATAVLSGRLARLGGTNYVVSLELTSAARGISLASFQATAEGDKALLPTIDRLTRELRGKIGESLRKVQRSIALEDATTPNLEALRKYTDGAYANDVERDFDKAVPLLREALALDSTFGLAWRKLAIALANGSGSRAAQDSAAQRAFQYADRLPDREKYLAIGMYYQMSPMEADRAKSLAAYRAAYAADSNSSTAANQLTNLYSARHEVDSTLRYARRQVAIRPDFNTVAWLVGNLEDAGRVEEATAVLDSVQRAAPESRNNASMRDAWYVRFMREGRSDSAEAMLAAMVASSRVSERIDGSSLAGDHLLTAGKVAGARARYEEVLALRAQRGATSTVVQQLMAPTLDIDVLGRSADGVRALDAVVASAEWKETPPSDRPYLWVAVAYARAGRADQAKALLARLLAEDPTAKAPWRRTRIAVAEGEIALAEGKFAGALRFFRAGSVGLDGATADCIPCTEYNLARAFDGAGEVDSAMAHYSAYLALPLSLRLVPDNEALAHVRKRLGELYDGKNDRANAMKYYSAFVEQWKDADPELQPTVATVRKRLAELQTQEGK